VPSIWSDLSEGLVQEEDDGLLAAYLIAIDMEDCGVEYSSTSYLRHFPFDRIEICRALTRRFVGPGPQGFGYR
jgi:predicted signal transduction protein with EAL and GGDEF domain